MAANEEVEIFDSWEEMEDSGALDRKLQNLKISPCSETEMRRSFADHTANKEVILMGDDAYRTQYVPPEPTVKILKRPTPNSQGGGDGPLLNGDSKPARKTLQQREQEYAEARLRILGQAKSPEEIVEDRINKIQGKVEVLRAPDIDCIIRLPRGPDGTRGFNVRR